MVHDILRNQLLELLGGRNAHFTFDDVVKAFPTEAINQPPPNVSYTPWHLIEHLRIAQWDILEFIRNPEHVSPKWPEGYWPKPEDKAGEVEWQESLGAFRQDLKAIETIVSDTQIDLVAELPHAPGYTYLREVLLVADHNAYHIGEFAILRQVMGTWR